MTWQVRSLGDVADLQSGVGFPPGLQGRMAGELPLAKVGDISRAVRAGGQGFVAPLNHITRAEASDLRARVFPRGSTVFAKIGEAIAQNFRLFTDREVALDNNAMGAIPRTGIEPRYLFRFLQTIDLYAYSSKTTVPSLRKSELEQIPIPVPPPAEQRRIADILDKADAIRRKRKEAIALTEELLRSAFLEMFGDPVTNPKGWPVKPLGELLQAPLRNGLSPASGGKFEAQVLTLSAITRGQFDASASKSGAFAVEPWEDVRVDARDFLICRGNGNVALVGSAAFPGESMKNMVFPDTMIAARIEQARVRPAFLNTIWKSPFIRRQVEAGARTTNGTFKINQTVVEGIEVILPPPAKQQVFADLEARVAKNAVHQRAAIEGAADLFDSLVARAFSGELSS